MSYSYVKKMNHYLIPYTIWDWYLTLVRKLKVHIFYKNTQYLFTILA